MDALADELSGYARALDGLPAVRLENWASPAAQCAKRNIEDGLRTSHDGASRLHAQAAEIRRAAVHVRAEQATWDRRAALALDASRGGRP